MDWRVFFMTLSAVFLAELADKTQMVSMTLTAKTGKPVSVWFGSVCGYMLVTVLSVVIGAVLAKYLRPDLIRYTGSFIFVCIGILMFLKVI
jgi:putative Ca2+/H+ antiporter (TMEM165/GDT1 family)